MFKKLRCFFMGHEEIVIHKQVLEVLFKDEPSSQFCSALMFRCAKCGRVREARTKYYYESLDDYPRDRKYHDEGY